VPLRKTTLTHSSSTRWPPWASTSRKLRSARHYRPGQLAGYGVDRFVGAAARWSPVPPHRALAPLVPASPDRSALRAFGERTEVTALAPPWRPDLHGDVPRGRWRFQESEARFAGAPDWESADRSLLWRFHLHYLDPPAALAAADPAGDWQDWLAELLEDHWARCRPGSPRASWGPFVLAVRTANLIRIWALLEARGGASPRLDAALALHTRAAFAWLPTRLEHHLQGNHLLKELCAMTLAARVWGSPRQRARWEARLRRQTTLQFLDGGGHEERSPRYHLDCVRDLAEVRAALGPDAPQWLTDAVRAGIRFAAAIAHEDGDVPLFNDCELGVTRSAASLAAATGLDPGPLPPLRSFPAEGYVAARLGANHLAVDCGPVGPDHQPGHAHCDLLSFEWSRGGRRIVGNRGTLAYGTGPDRDVSRTTRSHSTVQIDEEEQVEIWGSFRVGWRSSPRLLQAEIDGDLARIAGEFRWHERVGATHRRTWELDGTRSSLTVRDDVRLKDPRREVTARLWLPDAVLTSSSMTEVAFQTGGLGTILRVDGASLTATETTWFPRQGLTAPAVLVEVRPPRHRTEHRFVTELRPTSP